MPARFFKARNFGYVVLAFVLFLAGWLGLATPFLTILFAYFLLEKLSFTRRKRFTVVLFCVIVLSLLYAFAFFVREAVTAFPRIAETTIPAIVTFAEKHNVNLPFENPQELRQQAKDQVKERVGELGKFARIASKEFAFVVIGLVVAICIFVNPIMDLDRDRHQIPRNYYTVACEDVAHRFKAFYHSFRTVMGAQLIISGINTVLSGIYVYCIHLPYAPLIIVLTFLCGLLPILGNVISNSTIVALSFLQSPQLALASLIFLIVLHKLEYFLNSKIVGDRIRNPIWLTLLALIIGERLIGVPGMILAPVVLHFIKDQASQREVKEEVTILSAETRDRIVR
jgi:predicted PurR-regulated permease PerM